MRKLLWIPFILCAWPLAASAAEDKEPSPSSDSRMKLLTYDESDVYTITTRYGYQTNIVFSSEEEIHTISVGDRSLWQIIPSANRLFIRPMEEGVITNMTIITNIRSYQFDLKSAAADKTDGTIYVARFVYPDERKKEPPVFSPPPTAAPAFVPAARPSAVSAPSSPAVTQPVSANYNYSYTGSDHIAPVQVYDDGRSTFIKYRNNAPLPEIYIVTEGAAPRPTTYYMQNDALVIDAVAAELLLKSGESSVHVYNEMFESR